MARILRALLPLVVFAVVVWFLWKGLSLDPHQVPSPLIDKAAPAFTLPRLHAPDQTFSAADLKGQVWVLNVWGSWCGSCRVEHPLLVQLAKSGMVPIYGLDWKDKREDAIAWLEKFGNPYKESVSDLDGRVAINFGVYGAPETFVIDKQGVIRHKQIGPVTPEALRDTILPLIKRLQQ
jgi:cytochrome c biogenesis protein CcmG, thiol:disulfide interchange protein DsbE